VEFALSDDQQAISRMVQDLMEGEIGPRTAQIDEDGVFPVRREPGPRSWPRVRDPHPSGSPQGPLWLGRHEAASKQPGLQEPTDPGGVGHIGLAPGHLLDMWRVHQQKLGVVLFTPTW
jgi:hypothetical protein